MTVNVLTVGPGKLTIGAPDALTNWAGQVTSAKVVPNVKKGDPIDVLSGEQVPGERNETFTLEATILNDFGYEGSLVEWCWEHRGEQQPFDYQPNSSLGKKVKGVIVVEPIEIGGDVKSKPRSDVKFDTVGAPTIVAAAA